MANSVEQASALYSSLSTRTALYPSLAAAPLATLVASLRSYTADARAREQETHAGARDFLRATGLAVVTPPIAALPALLRASPQWPQRADPPLAVGSARWRTAQTAFEGALAHAAAGATVREACCSADIPLAALESAVAAARESGARQRGIPVGKVTVSGVTVSFVVQCVCVCGTTKNEGSYSSISESRVRGATLTPAAEAVVSAAAGADCGAHGTAAGANACSCIVTIVAKVSMSPPALNKYYADNIARALVMASAMHHTEGKPALPSNNSKTSSAGHGEPAESASSSSSRLGGRQKLISNSKSQTGNCCRVASAAGAVEGTKCPVSADSADSLTTTSACTLMPTLAAAGDGGDAGIDTEWLAGKTVNEVAALVANTGVGTLSVAVDVSCGDEGAVAAQCQDGDTDAPTVPSFSELVNSLSMKGKTHGSGSNGADPPALTATSTSVAPEITKAKTKSQAKDTPAPVPVTEAPSEVTEFMRKSVFAESSTAQVLIFDGLAHVFALTPLTVIADASRKHYAARCEAARVIPAAGAAVGAADVDDEDVLILAASSSSTAAVDTPIAGESPASTASISTRCVDERGGEEPEIDLFELASEDDGGVDVCAVVGDALSGNAGDCEGDDEDSTIASDCDAEDTLSPVPPFVRVRCVVAFPDFFEQARACQAHSAAAAAALSAAKAALVEANRKHLSSMFEWTQRLKNSTDHLFLHAFATPPYEDAGALRDMQSTARSYMRKAAQSVLSDHEVTADIILHCALPSVSRTDTDFYLTVVLDDDNFPMNAAYFRVAAKRGFLAQVAHTCVTTSMSVKGRWSFHTRRNHVEYDHSFTSCIVAISASAACVETKRLSSPTSALTTYGGGFSLSNCLLTTISDTLFSECTTPPDEDKDEYDKGCDEGKFYPVGTVFLFPTTPVPCAEAPLAYFISTDRIPHSLLPTAVPVGVVTAVGQTKALRNGLPRKIRPNAADVSVMMSRLQQHINSLGCKNLSIDFHGFAAPHGNIIAGRSKSAV